MNIVIPVALVAVVGLLASCMLSYASKVFAVQEDQLFLDLRAELPGANCGGCGFAGCDDYAHAMAEGGETPCTKCSVGGPAVAKKLASLLGQDAGSMEKKMAFVMCNGTTDNASKLYEYEDIDSCKAAKQLFGGSKTCPYGCIGLGDCVQACEFDAIRIIDGVAVVGRDYCTSCGDVMLHVSDADSARESALRVRSPLRIISVRSIPRSASSAACALPSARQARSRMSFTLPNRKKRSRRASR